MRRVAALVVVLLTALGLATSVAATTSYNFKDEFHSDQWTGDDGSLHWDGPWSEVGDDGDPKKGKVRVISSEYCAGETGLCMSISGSLIPKDRGAWRRADTSSLADLKLCFDARAVPGVIDTSTLTVSVSTDGGDTWSSVDALDVGSLETPTHPVIDLARYRSEDFALRLVVSGLVSTSQVYIDNVEIRGVPAESTTTVSTSSSTTSSTSTSSTTASSTTTSSTTTSSSTVPDATTTTQPAATTDLADGGTDHGSTTTRPDGESSTTTSTTRPESTTTTVPATTDTTDRSELLVSVGPSTGSGSGPGAGSPVAIAIPDGSGIREATRGLQASFDSGLFGHVDDLSTIGAVGLDARFVMVAEVIRSSWIWMVLLALVVAWSIVVGIDHRRPLPADV